jgi:hypothetical protein
LSAVGIAFLPRVAGARQGKVGEDVKLAFLRYSRAMVSNLCVLNVETIHTDELDVLAAIRRAVSVWSRTTEQGKAVLQYAEVDLNIGDLDSHEAFENPQFLLAL